MSEVAKRIQVDLTGRIALVTGAARGLGRCFAVDLAAAGAKVACVDINAETLAETISCIRAAGGTAEPIAADVTNSQRVDEVVDEVVKLWGGLDILVNNAGITRDNLIMRMKDDQWDAVLEHQPQGHIPLHPRGRPADVQVEIRPDHQHRQRLGADGQSGPGQLLGLEGGRDRPDADRQPRTGQPRT